MHCPRVDCISTSAYECEENSISKLIDYKLNAAEKIAIAGHYRQGRFQSSSQEGLVAMVTNLSADSDLDSSSSDSEDRDDIETALDGYAHIIWTNLEESIENIDDILVVDRGLLHSDIVASVSDPLGQMGIVVDVDLRVDLKTNSGETIRNFDSRKLQRIKAFERGDYVIHGSWLGRVDKVVDNVTVLFDDGSKCRVMRADPECLIPVSRNLIEDAHYPYHPGQHVRGITSAVFKNARWMCGTWNARHMEGIVSNVDVGSVYVYWIAAVSSGCESRSTTIPTEQHDPKQLKLLSHFSYAKWQLGDWCLLPKSGRTLEGAVRATQDLTSDMSTQIPVENETLHALDYGTAVSRSKETMPGSCVRHLKKSHRCVIKQDRRGCKTEDIIERALFVVNIKTKVDVIWQDGTRSFGIDSRNLFPVDNMGDHEFWPEQYILEKTLDDDSEARRVGIVQTVDSKERTAYVRWLKPVKSAEDPQDFDKEVVSVYELAEHPDYNYCIGDIVIRLSPIPKSSEVFWTVGHPSNQKECEDNSKPENDGVTTASYSEKSPLHKKQKVKIGGSFKESDLSWFGTITGLQDGDIEVTWADGIVSKVGPQEIFVVDRDDYDVSGRSSFEESTQDNEDDASSWRTIDSDRMDVLDEEEQLLKKGEEPTVEHSAMENDDGVATMKNTVYPEKITDHQKSGSLSFTRTVFGFVAQFAYGLLGFMSSKGLTDATDSELQGGASQDQGPEEILDETCKGKTQRQNLSRDSQCLVPDYQRSIRDDEFMLHNSLAVSAEKEGAGSMDGSECKYCSSKEEAHSLQSKGEVAALDVLGELKSNVDTKQRQEDIVVPKLSGLTDDVPRYFKHFDSVKDPLDHYFLSEKIQPSSQRKWTKKVQQEWSVLEKCLPDRIYVRVYEDRMDLLRAVIIGAAGTPYHDGLFLFDLHFPPDYPHSPPLIYYYSGGLRLNPNLYETGKVCLSLLNTWTGSGNEVWDPTNSSILQVLVSLQGLVLNGKPYFNEAGYDRQMGTAEGEKNSLIYNENSFLLSCKLMLYLLRRPPKHFEVLVKEHFQNRGHYIILACDAYMKGAQVGSLSQDVTWSLQAGSDSRNSSSVGFKLMLTKIIPKLVSAFSDIGVDCQQLSQLISKLP